METRGRMTDELPRQSLLFGQRDRFAYADCFRLPLRRRDIESWELIAAFFHASPGWFEQLAALRDRLVKRLGLKTSAGNPREAEPPFQLGQRLGFFRLIELSPSEALLGDEDKHLDFRVSLLVGTEGDDPVLTVSTVVQTKNRLGRAYFAVVRPVHRLIVPLMVREMARLLDARGLPAHFYAAERP